MYFLAFGSVMELISIAGCGGNPTVAAGGGALPTFTTAPLGTPLAAAAA
jgi:hypothetical protein